MLAGHYGFTPRGVQAYRARTQGKDERMVSYLNTTSSSATGRFESWAHLQQLAEQWLREEADQRGPVDGPGSRGGPLRAGSVDAAAAPTGAL